ncbi:hypothetical protein [Kitasatospora sp. NPDC093806]|uniref:hypothetical protein n=1 Tax=Kitasatospora sp. NPDC093806 TaxID=3155075 RepID=UPI0034473D0B
MDEMNEYDRLEAARKLLADRYSRPSCTPALDLLQEALAEIARSARPGADDAEAPEEVLLAALTVLNEARAELDASEVSLVRSTRARGVSWDLVAGAQGLRTRQSAETRAKRLQSIVRGSLPGRDRVAVLRREEAHERAREQWVADHADRVRGVADALIDTSGAWTGGGLFIHFNMLATQLAADKVAEVCGTLGILRYELTPPRFNEADEPPVPTGPRAAEAEAARRALEELLDERRDAELAVVRERDRVTATRRQKTAEKN